MTDKMFMEVQDVTEMLNISKVNTKYFFKKLIYNEE